MIGKKIFGLDISDHSIEALILTKSKPFFGKCRVVAYARTILRGEVVSNGIIKKPEKLGENIVKLLASAQPEPIKTSYCILSLPESQVFTTVFKLPAGLRHNEIKNTLLYKAEEVIPFKSSEIYFDFKTIIRQGPTQEVFYVAIPIKVVDAYTEVLKNLGLKPVAFDLESISLARALVNAAKKSDQAKLLVDIGSRTTSLNIFDRNGIRQSSIVKIAGNRFTKAIASSLQITDKEAEELKVKNGFDPQKQKAKALSALQNEFKKIIVEAKKLIDYYQTENQREVGEIILAGGSALLPKVDQYLADNLERETNIGNPFKKVINPQSLAQFKNKAVLFANVFGLALRTLCKDPIGGDINLLPAKLKIFALMPQKEEKRAWRLIYLRLAVLVILFLVLGAVFALNQKGYDFYQRVFSPPQYETNISSDIDVDVLEELRQHFLIPEEVSAEEEVTKPEVIRVKIKPLAGGFLNVREGPGSNYPKISQVTPGQEFDLIKQENDWYQIQLDKETVGWVISTYADLIEGESNKKEAEPEVLEEGVKLNFKIRVKETSLGYLNVRQGPGLDFEKIGQVSPGQEFEVLAEVGGWYKIQFTKDSEGWVYSVYVDKLE